MTLETVTRMARNLFGSHHSAADLELKIAHVDAKENHIQAQLNRMQDVFDEWAEEHQMHKEARQ